MALRLLAHSWHRLTLVLAISALAIRFIIPAGFMPDPKHLGIVICTGHGPLAMTIAIPSDKPGPSHQGSQPDQPCGFGGALVSVLPPIDPVVLLAAIAFIVAERRITADNLPVWSPAWLRPPTRGPPVFGTA